MRAAELALFRSIAAQPEASLDLARAALLIAEAEYPGLDVARYIEQLDALGAEAKRRVSAAAPSGKLAALLAWLYGELGFRGNDRDYYDPRNSFLNEVLERRTGIPITLALVIMEVGRRAGLTVEGVGFPGHFLARSEQDGALAVIDPFSGELCDEDKLRELYRRATGESRVPDRALLVPVGKRAILSRMLNNLRGIWATRGDAGRLAAVEERLAILEQGAAAPAGPAN